MKSHFFAYMSKMKFIKRWAIMRNIQDENIQEHSLQTAMIAHALAIIKNKFYGGDLNPERIALLAVYHEASEVITGDLPTPIKYYNSKIRDEYKKIEEIANDSLLKMLPVELQPDYEVLIKSQESEKENHKIVKAADRLCAYIKCLEELKMGNDGFSKAKETIEKDLKNLCLPEVDYFIDTFLSSFSLTLDELN